MAEGTVKWFDAKKGYGFIARSGHKDVFVHYSNIAGEGYKQLKDGDVVEFEVAKGAMGPRADNVVIKSSAEKAE